MQSSSKNDTSLRESLPWWHPLRHVNKRPFLVARSKILQAIRGWFADSGFIEVDTPALQVSPGNEVHIDAFRTELVDRRGGDARELWLHTSPEFAMKKLLVAGEKQIYQMCHAWRNGEISTLHSPEFTMLEWYRAAGTTADLQRDCINLTRAACQAVGTTVFTVNGMICDPFKQWQVLSVPDAFQQYAGIDLLATAPDPHNPDAALLAPLVRGLGLHTDHNDRWDDLVFRVLMAKIEPFLGKDVPTFLTDYPISMAALARTSDHDHRLADRFELYMAGIEIANAFYELTDAAEQEERFRKDMALRKSLYGTAHPIDPDFIAALRVGMPTSAGIALGVDRLIMLCSGASNVNDVLWAPVDLHEAIRV